MKEREIRRRVERRNVSEERNEYYSQAKVFFCESLILMKRRMWGGEDASAKKTAKR